jgi:hypothetical protein
VGEKVNFKKLSPLDLKVRQKAGIIVALGGKKQMI